MRANGVDERYITGNAEPFEKFQAWAATVPHTLRNPLYHWTHLELARYFDIDELLDEVRAPHLGLDQRKAARPHRQSHPQEVRCPRPLHHRRSH